MHDYYTKKLSALKLKEAYEIAPPRVRKYLESEIDYLLERIGPNDRILELGCGYGRILEKLSTKTSNLFGIDTAENSLRLALDVLNPEMHGHLLQMDAVRLGFKADVFDFTVCMQNGVSAFKVDPLELVREAARVTRSGGAVVFSSYAEAFWPHRLEWFRLQADHGLVGEIDENATGCGVIVCKDGFQATTFGPGAFRTLAEKAGLSAVVTELEAGSLICEMKVP